MNRGLVKYIIGIGIASIVLFGCSGNVESENDGSGYLDGQAVLSKDWKDQLIESKFDKVNIQKIVFLDSMVDSSENADDLIEYVSHPKDKNESTDGSPDVDMWEDTSDGLFTVYISAPGGVYAPKDSSYLFHAMINLEEIEFNDAFHSQNMENMEEMFSEDVMLESLDLSEFETGRVTNMRRTFARCTQLKYLNISSIDTSNVTNMSYTFGALRNLPELDVSNLDTSKVVEMDYMFAECENLKQLDVSGFDTSKVRNMNYMFFNCINLENVDVSNFDISQMTESDMEYMFLGSKIETMGMADMPQ